MNSVAIGLLLSGIPLMGSIVSLLFKQQQKIGQCSTLFVWTGLLLTLILSSVQLSIEGSEQLLGFQLDSISMVLMVLIFFISSTVHKFSIKYFEGRDGYKGYFLRISCLTTTLLLMVQSNHLLLLILFLTISNGLLISLIGMESGWEPSRQSARLTRNTLSWVTVLLGISALFFFLNFRTYSISELYVQSNLLWYFAVIPLMVALFIQSGLFPFHRSLVSSLNAPSTVSAFMHADLVNGGGIVLIKFSYLLERNTFLLDIMLIMGFTSVVVGTAWKIIQTSVKGSLVFSTVAQMGFMIFQCGLGLFSATLAHLIWHSLFKAFLFLRCGSVLKENMRINREGVSLFKLLTLSVCAFPATWVFAKFTGYAITPENSSFVLVVFAFFVITQLMISITQEGHLINNFGIGFVVSIVFASIYGLSIGFVEGFVFESSQSPEQPLSILHILILSLSTILWSFHNLKIKQTFFRSEIWKNLYVRLLNSSQPQTYTINL